MRDAILEPLERLSQLVEAKWSHILATLLLLIGGWLAARFVRLVLVRGLRIARLDLVSQKAGIEGLLKRGGIRQDSVELLGALVYWLAVLLVFVIIMKIWGIDAGLENTILQFVPRLFISLIIVIVGMYTASFVGELVASKGERSNPVYSRLVGSVVRWVIVIFVVLTALQQLGVETQLISIGFLMMLGSLALGFGLALGLGTKDIVARRLEDWLKQLEGEKENHPGTQGASEGGASKPEDPSSPSR